MLHLLLEEALLPLLPLRQCPGASPPLSSAATMSGTTSASKRHAGTPYAETPNASDSRRTPVRPEKGPAPGVRPGQGRKANESARTAPEGAPAVDQIAAYFGRTI